MTTTTDTGAKLDYDTVDLLNEIEGYMRDGLYAQKSGIDIMAHTKPQWEKLNRLVDALLAAARDGEAALAANVGLRAQMELNTTQYYALQDALIAAREREARLWTIRPATGWTPATLPPFPVDEDDNRQVEWVSRDDSTGEEFVRVGYWGDGYFTSPDEAFEFFEGVRAWRFVELPAADAGNAEGGADGH